MPALQPININIKGLQKRSQSQPSGVSICRIQRRSQERYAYAASRNRMVTITLVHLGIIKTDAKATGARTQMSRVHNVPSHSKLVKKQVVRS